MTTKSPITTHVLDTARGRPARGVRVTLEIERRGAFVELASGTTNDDGRVADLLPPGKAEPGTYRLTFHAGEYLKAAGLSTPFYPTVPVVFRVDEASEHYHVPLLLSPYGYSTYRGS